MRTTTGPRWETRAHTDRPLTLTPGQHATLRAMVEVPADLAGQDLAVNLVSEHIAWFDVCGTPTLHLHVPTQP